MNGKLMDGSEAVEISILNDKKIKYFQIDFDTKSPLALENIKAYRQMCDVLKNNYDLIHCHTPIPGVVTRIAANKYRMKGTKVIYTTHGFTFTDIKNAKKMHCKNVFIIPSVGLDNKRFENLQINRDEYRKSIGVDKDEIMVLTVGELSVRKNQQIIIKAIGKLKDKGNMFW